MSLDTTIPLIKGNMIKMCVALLLQQRWDYTYLSHDIATQGRFLMPYLKSI